MANPWAGEVTLHIDGNPIVCKLTLGVLAELEEELGEDSIIGLLSRFESGRFSARDVFSIVFAGLRGGGWQGTKSDLTVADIEDGPASAAKSAGLLLSRAFTLPSDAR